jgi:hypothetical protein
VILPELHGRTANLMWSLKMKKLSLTAALVVAAAASITTATPTLAYGEAKVPFLQAALFFMTGEEPTADRMERCQRTGATKGCTIGDRERWVELVSDKKARVRTEVFVHPNSTTGDLIAPAAWVTYEYEIKEDPCKIYGRIIQPTSIGHMVDINNEPIGFKRLEFMKLPSPRSFVEDSRSLSFTLPNDTWCSTKSVVEDGEVKFIRGSTLCNTSMAFPKNSHFYRRIAALDYIRANFCAGQPEPPLKPGMPY